MPSGRAEDMCCAFRRLAGCGRFSITSPTRHTRSRHAGPGGSVFAMADRPTRRPRGRGDEPASTGSTAPSARASAARRDPEPTQMLPTFAAPRRSPGSEPRDRPAARQVPTSPPAPPSRPRRSRRPALRRSRPPVPAAGRVGEVRRPAVAGVPGRGAAHRLAADRQGRRHPRAVTARAEQPGTTYLLVGSDSREGLTRKQQLALGVGKGGGPPHRHDHAAAHRLRARTC